MFNVTFNNISVLLWGSVLLVEETGVHGENHWPVASHWQTLSHNVVSSTPHHERGLELTTLVVIGTECICSCKSNYHTITATTAPYSLANDHIYSKQLSSQCNLTAQLEPVHEKYLNFHNRPSQYIAISKRYRESMDVLPERSQHNQPREKNLMKNTTTILFHKTKSSDYLCTTPFQSISSIWDYYFLLFHMILLCSNYDMPWQPSWIYHQTKIKYLVKT